MYQRPLAPPAPPDKSSALLEFAQRARTSPKIFARLLAAPAIASKRWISEQYDYMVRTNTLVRPGAGDAAVVRIKGTKRALALATDGNGRWCCLDPVVGAKLAVAEAARNVACSGAKPWAATNCLNFGNPEKPEVMWQFSGAIDGIAEACRALGFRSPAATSASTTRRWAGRSIPRRCWACWGDGRRFARAGDGVPRRRRRDCAARRPRGQLTASGSDAREFSSSEYARTIHGIVAARRRPWISPRKSA